MAEIPKELQKFNIKVICCNTQPNTHEWLIRKVCNEVEEQEKQKKFNTYKEEMEKQRIEFLKNYFNGEAYI